MKDICNLYLKRLRILRNRLCMTLELLQGIPPSGVSTLLLRSVQLLPFNTSLSLKDLPHDIDDEENRSINFKSSLIIYVQKIISSLLTIYKERSLQFHTDIELNISMSLDDNDPAAKEEDDNFLFYILAPWQELWPEIINTELSCQEAADRLYNYIIQTAIPSIEIKDFLRVGNLYADITKIEAKGYRIDHDANKAIEITQEKVADLLGMKGLQETSAIAPNAHPIVKACITYIEDLITLIDQLMDSTAKKDGAMDRLAIKLDTLLHHDRRIREFRRMGDCLLSYAERPAWKLFGTEHHAQMACLDSLMRELENLAVERINHNHQDTEISLKENGFKITIEDFPDGNILTFWTNMGDSSCAVPFWEVETSTGLFIDGEDWHEFHPYKPMCYLSHIAFVDGDINFEELKHINYITWEMRFRHNITVNISGSPKNQE